MVPHRIYLDRYRNEGTRVYSPHAGYTEALERYRPNSGHERFELPVFRLPRAELNVYQANPPEALTRIYLPQDEALFCIHPQLLSVRPDEPYVRRTLKLGGPAEPIMVSPSSSTRTLYVRTPEAEGAGPALHSLKVHFPFRVSRYGRKMRDEVVEQAVTVSEEMEAAIGELAGAVARLGEGGAGPNPGFAFLREVLGITHRNLDPESARGENWGFLVREMTPFPPVEGRAAQGPGKLIPAFALYGKDRFEPARRPLILDLLDGRDPRTFVLEEIFFPIIRHWVGCFHTLGFVLEPHGQNVLLEVGGGGRVTRIVHRDLSVAIDMRRREVLGRVNPRLNQYNRMETGAFNSIAYDKFMGGHFFHHLVSSLQASYPKLRIEDFRGPCREEFARVFPEHAQYMPATVQYFSEARDEFGKPHFQDTGEAPAWRP